jgi:hypothetical protein
MRNLLIAGVCGLLIAGCSGNGDNDSGSGPPAEASFLTADVRGVSGELNPGGGVPAPPDGSGDFGGVADIARQEIVRAIEEADLYRVAGDRLYLLNAYRGLTIVDLARLEMLGRLPVSGVPLEMYLRGDRVLVLFAGPQGDTQLMEVSVTDPALPAVSGSATMSGAYRTSRLIGEVLYAVTEQELLSFRLDVAPFAAGASVALGEGAGFAHATDTFIYLAGSDGEDGTTVRLVDVSDPAGAIALRGSIDLPGYVGDDQKLNFGGGVLRVVTHDWNDSGLSRLFTVDVTDPDAPALLATLELARGEQLFATQFTEDRAYLVTFEQVDPLWVVDLADPSYPVVAGELVVPGYSMQMVADGTQLVTIGVDPDLDWQTTVSLFDVSNPAAPALLDREELGDSGSLALWERKAFSVSADRILVPRWDGLAVLDRSADSLATRGVIGVAGGALRGFLHDAGLVAIGNEELVVTDAATLDVLGRLTIAENVIDVGRLADGTLLRLVQTGNYARLNGAEVELWAEAMYPFGDAVALVGWDTQGRAAYVMTFDQDSPRVSARLGLDFGSMAPGGGAKMGAGAPDMIGGGAAIIAPMFSGPQTVLTASGKLVLRGLPAGESYVFGDGDPADGLIVIDIPAGALDKGVAVSGAVITGVAADGTVLAFTMARFAGQDDFDRPLLENEYVRVDLDAGSATQPVSVPGYLVAANGADLFTVEDIWAEDWSVTSSVVAARIDSGAARVLDRLALPAGAYDLRAVGATLFFSTGDDLIVPMLGVLDGPDRWIPESHIGTVRLGAALAAGAEIGGSDAFRTLLLPEDGAALILRDGFTVERWDTSGATAELAWQETVSSWPLRAHADAANAGKYLLALGYAGDVSLP